MKFDHMVKYNGVYYSAGEDVPNEEKKVGAENNPLPFSDKEITFETLPEEKKYTKSEINGMSKADLQSLALENGVNNAMGMTGTELKALLIKMLVK